MSNSATQTPPELEVSNFGPIVEAKIELRPLTVFVGPSNTGKSYLAILIYALHRFFSRTGDRADETLAPKNTAAVEEWAEQMFGYSEERRIVLPDPVKEEIRSRLDEQKKLFANEISRCFGMASTGALIRKGTREEGDLVVRRKQSKDSVPFEFKLNFKDERTEFKTTIPPKVTLPQVQDFEQNHMGEIGEVLDYFIDLMGESRLVIEILIDHLARFQFGGPLYFPAFYLPADRTGVMHAHSVVVSAMIGSAPMTGLRPAAGTPMLSGVLADFLQQLIEIDRPGYRGRGQRRDLGTRIEETILGGSVRIDRSETIGYPHFSYQPKGWKDPLPLMNASSMVSELAPVVLYLRHVVQPGETLIIEEPESHLHPAMQVEFTRQLAALVHAGVRVIVTTHSEWVLEELANIVRRSELPAARQKEIPRGEFALRSDQVGAWLFEPKLRPKGSVVKEIRLDDSGLYPSEYSEVANSLHNDWAEISSLIGEAE